MLNRLFCFWTGDNEMPDARRRALRTMSSSKLDVCLITKNNLAQWEVKGNPIHPAYAYLSAVHRADYLRVYFMHHYGGGYSDIKNINDSWVPAVDDLINSNAFGVGYKEVGPRGVAMLRSWKYILLVLNWKYLLGNGAYIFKPGTEFTKKWLERTEICLSRKLNELKSNPARHPEDYKGRKLSKEGGHLIDYSKYPLRWSEMLGDIFHPLCYEYRGELLNSLPAPDLNSDYD